MNKINVGRIDIEDYYGIAIDTIEFESPIEMDYLEFDVRVDSFSCTGCEDLDDEDGATVRLQYEFEEKNGDEEEINYSTTQILSVIMDYSEGNLNENKLYEKIYQALELII
tara:strand:- start:5263 stop:5595 length:333 start_codon:yes stop_codon:yes gene_type:complete